MTNGWSSGLSAGCCYAVAAGGGGVPVSTRIGHTRHVDLVAIAVDSTIATRMVGLRRRRPTESGVVILMKQSDRHRTCWAVRLRPESRLTNPGVACHRDLGLGIIEGRGGVS